MCKGSQFKPSGERELETKLTAEPGPDQGNPGNLTVCELKPESQEEPPRDFTLGRGISTSKLLTRDVVAALGGADWAVFSFPISAGFLLGWGGTRENWSNNYSSQKHQVQMVLQGKLTKPLRDRKANVMDIVAEYRKRNKDSRFSL